jgi:hypothetical protein
MTGYASLTEYIRNNYSCDSCGALRGDYCLTSSGRETDSHQSRREKYSRDSHRPFRHETSPGSGYRHKLTEPFKPQRNDEVAEWLKRKRDDFEPHSLIHMTIDQLLDDYRLHADTGTPLEFNVDDGGVG